MFQAVFWEGLIIMNLNERMGNATSSSVILRCPSVISSALAANSFKKDGWVMLGQVTAAQRGLRDAHATEASRRIFFKKSKFSQYIYKTTKVHPFG
jgi:hypothetical protein